ncbi:hypothetical protein EBZ80_14640 [bacterium]|nr:hypothetical protein [bacterium]
MMSACGKGQVNPKETQRTFGSARSDLENAPRKSTDAAAVTTGDSDSGASSQSSWECLVFQTNCEKLPKLFRCARGGLAGTYSGPMYVKNATQCSDAQMEMEPAPLFLGLPGLDRDIVAWSRAGQGGTKYYRYEKSGDNPGSGFQREGIAFSVSSREFTHPKKVVLYSCEVDCTQLATNAQCEAGMSFIALERECEGKGTPKGLLGYAIAP